ncbi:MAG: HD domain-containing protein [Lachnospiraceae bacterium]|nr:HD domain-containing protein [Lachnospiraceae bacterium]
MVKKDEEKGSFSRLGRQFLCYLLLVLINIALNRLVTRLGLPLYIDNVGTLLAAFLGGYLPGIFVGYATNIINATADPTNAYYASISVLIAVCGAFLARRGAKEKLWKALLSIPVFAFIGGVLGSVLTYLMYGFGMGEGISAPFAIKLLQKGSLSVFWAQMISDVSIDLIDKTITVLIVFIIIKLIPKKYLNFLEMTDWKQKPFSGEERKASIKNSTRKLRLRYKLIIIIGTVMTIIAFVTAAISYILYQRFAIEQFTHTGNSIACFAASEIDGDKVDEYLETKVKDDDYYYVEKALMDLRATNPYVEYLYVYQIREDGCHVVFDLDTEELEASELGDVVEFDESFHDLLPDLLAGNEIEPIITDDTYGWLLTDYEPIYDSKGKCVAYACTDINMKDVRLNGISFLTKILSLFIGFFIFILTLCLWLSKYHLTYPIDAMTFVARKFAYHSEEDRESSVEMLQSLDISTGDEIENLYESMAKTISDTVGYIDEVQKKGDEISHMQNGLIYIMADLVESRDKCTGDHVKKTAAYVKLILNLLKENNLYSETLTDEYIQDVCNSAPLHDVGKIKVSDVILNKPARLTDEEFEIMKSHTTAGQKIIESAMKLTTDTGYLKEALNLATYHHEKWDGSGYPRGLKEYEIPLSARIMAVSDVFDALVSARSYKKPFSFEEAMKIIEEGAGKHFDPVIANVFVENADLVREIAEEHKRTIG